MSVIGEYKEHDSMPIAVDCIIFGFDGKDLRRVGGDNLVLRIRRNDLYGHMLQAGEEYTFPHPRLQQ